MKLFIFQLIETKQAPSRFSSDAHLSSIAAEAGPKTTTKTSRGAALVGVPSPAHVSYLPELFSVKTKESYVTKG